MKKTISILTASLLAGSCLAMPAAAVNDAEGKLPFKLEAPLSVAVTWLNENDSPTTMSMSYSMGSTMNEWFAKCADPNGHDKMLKKLKEEYGYTELALDAQIDWAIDDSQDWHYTQYWDRTHDSDFGYDNEGHIRYGVWDFVSGGVDGVEAVQDVWMLRGVSVRDLEKEPNENNDYWEGTEYIPGLKNQLKEGQYTLKTIDEESGEQMVEIDWNEHNLYTRVRWAVTAYKEGDDNPIDVYYSDWSETASYGKDMEAFTPYTKETLAPPVITGLRYYEDEFNGYPQIACTLTVPDELAKGLTKVSSLGGSIYVEWEARVPDGEWINLQGDGDVTSGECVIALQNLAEAEKNVQKDTPIELRARYCCSQFNESGESLEDFCTDYSNVLTFGSEEMSAGEASLSESSSVDTPEKKQDENKCKVCGICPVQPLGICLFIWIAIILVLIIIVVIIVIVISKSKKKKN